MSLRCKRCLEIVAQLTTHWEPPIYRHVNSGETLYHFTWNNGFGGFVDRCSWMYFTEECVYESR
jgi:hypothetical protein